METRKWQWIVNKVARASKVASSKAVSRAIVLMSSAGERKSSAGSSRVDSSRRAASRDRKRPTPASVKM